MRGFSDQVEDREKLRLLRGSKGSEEVKGKKRVKEFANHLLELAASPWGPLVLILHGYLESFVLPVAHDLFLITVALANPGASFAYAAMSTLSSVLGIVTGYAVGHFGGKYFLIRLIGPKTVVFIKQKIHKYDAWAIAIACFTPVPVRFFAVVAGIVNLNFRKLILIGLMARGLRFFLIGALIFFYGETIRHLILEYIGHVMLLILLICILGVLLWKGVKRFIIARQTY